MIAISAVAAWACVLAFFPAFCAAHGGHACIHDTIANGHTMRAAHQTKKKGAGGKTTWERMRINVTYLDGQYPGCTAPGQVLNGWLSPGCGTGSPTYTCGSEDVLTADKRTAVQNHLNRAVQLWERALKVQQLDEAVISAGTQCCDVVLNETRAQADLLLYVTFHPTGQGSYTQAWATSCLQDWSGSGPLGRPIAGMINVSPHLISTATDAETISSNSHTMAHEIAHVLGFSSHLYSNFLNTGPGGNVTQTSTERNRPVTRLVTPNVARAAKYHFGCSSLAGAELEDGGGTGTSSSHWEKRVYAHEFMTGSGGATAYVSPLTIALFEDTGWYQATTSFERVSQPLLEPLLIEPLGWGKDEGCDFATERCSDWTASQKGRGYFCDSVDQGPQRCTADRKFIGYCDTFNYSGVASAVPSDRQYFTDPGLGGSQLADYCPRIVGYTNLDCTSTAVADATNAQTIGADSRCFDSTAQPQSTSQQPTHKSCHRHQCVSATELRILFTASDSDNYVVCPTDGGTVTLGSGTHAGFKGQVTCPPASELCQCSCSSSWTIPFDRCGGADSSVFQTYQFCGMITPCDGDDGGTPGASWCVLDPGCAYGASIGHCNPFGPSSSPTGSPTSSITPSISLTPSITKSISITPTASRSRTSPTSSVTPRVSYSPTSSAESGSAQDDSALPVSLDIVVFAGAFLVIVAALCMMRARAKKNTDKKRDEELSQEMAQAAARTKNDARKQRFKEQQAQLDAQAQRRGQQGGGQPKRQQNPKAAGSRDSGPVVYSAPPPTNPDFSGGVSSQQHRSSGGGGRNSRRAQAAKQAAKKHQAKQDAQGAPPKMWKRPSQGELV